MNAMALLIWVSAFSSFGWGVLRFFRRTSGVSWHTALVAVLGLVFGVWHLLAIASSNVRPPRSAVAIVLLSVSTLLFWWAVQACESRHLTAIFEDDLPCHLVRRGPYRHIRHPFYASYTMFWFAGWIASASVVSLISSAVMLRIYLEAVRTEERKFAASNLSGDYAEYRQRVGMMAPKLDVVVKRLFRRPTR